MHEKPIKCVTKWFADQFDIQFDIQFPISFYFYDFYWYVLIFYITGSFYAQKCHLFNFIIELNFI